MLFARRDDVPLFMNKIGYIFIVRRLGKQSKLICPYRTLSLTQSELNLHRVISTGTMDHRFEVLCKDRTGRGIRRNRVVQESLITVDGKAFCSCMLPNDPV